MRLCAVHRLEGRTHPETPAHSRVPKPWPLSSETPHSQHLDSLNCSHLAGPGVTGLEFFRFSTQGDCCRWLLSGMPLQGCGIRNPPACPLPSSSAPTVNGLAFLACWGLLSVPSSSWLHNFHSLAFVFMWFHQGRNEPMCSIHHVEPEPLFELSHHLVRWLRALWTWRWTCPASSWGCGNVHPAERWSAEHLLAMLGRRGCHSTQKRCLNAAIKMVLLPSPFFSPLPPQNLDPSPPHKLLSMESSSF